MLFLFVFSKYKICLTFCCQYSMKSVRVKKDIRHLNVYENMNKTVCLDIAKWNHFFMKPNNLTSLRRMSRFSSKLTISLSKLNVLQTQCIHTLLHPYSALSLIDSLPVLSEGRYAHAGNKIHDTEALVRASSAWAIRGNKAQICFSERTSGTGYC